MPWDNPSLLVIPCSIPSKLQNLNIQTKQTSNQPSNVQFKTKSFTDNRDERFKISIPQQPDTQEQQRDIQGIQIRPAQHNDLS